MAIAALIFGLLLTGGGLYYFIVPLRKFLKGSVVHEFDKKGLLTLLYGVVAASIGFGLLMLSLFLAHPEWMAKTVYGEGLYQGESIDYALQIAVSLVGAVGFAFFQCVLWVSFAVHYWQSKMKDPQRKNFTRAMFWAIPFSLAFFLMATCGIAPYLTYPLVSGFHLAGGFGWDYTYSRGDLHIAWYGLIILFGVCVSYWVCDHKFFQEYHKHGILDTLVIVAFLGGIIGARVWYVVGNWEREFAANQWRTAYLFGSEVPIWSPLAIWDGGITILGGAFAGVLVGAIYLRKKLPYVNIRWALDVCIPSILLAQAIGRWGNFFNVEVYGATVSLNSGWSWLPNWLALQMNCINQSTSHLATGMIHVPLFLIEGILSIAGYFIIVYGLGKGLKKYTVKGDLGGAYFIWYGLVRFVLEPFRDQAFNMGTNNAWSIINSIVYVVLGCAIILFLHLHDYFLKEKAKGFVAPLFGALLTGAALLFPLLISFTGTYGAGTTSAIVEFTGFDLLWAGKAPWYVASFAILAASFLAFVVASIMSGVQKSRLAKNVSFGAAFGALIASLIVFFASSTVMLDSSIHQESATLNLSDRSLSYGFVLFALFALCSVAVILSRLLAEHERNKQAKSVLAGKDIPMSETPPKP